MVRSLGAFWPKCSNGIDTANDIALSYGGVTGAEPFHCLWVGEHGEGFFEALEVFGADDDRGCMAVPGDDNSFVVVLDSVDVFGESVFYCPQRFGSHGYNCATLASSPATLVGCILLAARFYPPNTALQIHPDVFGRSGHHIEAVPGHAQREAG